MRLCACSGPPGIVRPPGRGEVLRPGDDGFALLLARAGPQAIADPIAKRNATSIDGLAAVDPPAAAER